MSRYVESVKLKTAHRHCFRGRFCFDGVFKLYSAEVLRCEIGNPCELQRFFFREGIADLDGAMVVDPNDITGISLFDLIS